MTQMVVRHPMEIAPTLNPGVRVGDAWVSVEPVRQTENGRIDWRIHITGSGLNYTEEAVQTGPRALPLGEIAREALGIVLEDLGDWSQTEAQRAKIYTPDVARWATRCQVELENAYFALQVCPTGECLICGATENDHTDTAHEFSHVCSAMAGCWEEGE